MLQRIVWTTLALTGLACAQLAPGTLIKAKLATEVESANAQVGDHVSAETTDSVRQGKVSLPKGSVLNGRVVAVTHARDNPEGGSVSVLFDQAVTPKGATVPVIAGIASVTPEAVSSPGGYGRPRGRRGGYPAGRPPAPASSPATNIRFPEDAAKSGSVLSRSSGDVWLNPQTKVTLRVIDASGR